MEMKSGKPQKQSIAIALEVQRRNKRKKMADGGVAREMPEDEDQRGGSEPAMTALEHEAKSRARDAEMARHEEAMKEHEADTEIQDENSHLSPGHIEDTQSPSPSFRFHTGKSIAEAIMQRRKMADGGEVDLDSNAREEGNLEDDLSWDALRKENYSEQSALDEITHPMDSNEHGDEIDSDKHDMVEQIRRKIKGKLI